MIRRGRNSSASTGRRDHAGPSRPLTRTTVVATVGRVAFAGSVSHAQRFTRHSGGVGGPCSASPGAGTEVPWLSVTFRGGRAVSDSRLREILRGRKKVVVAVVVTAFMAGGV